jgi:nicotinate-nucleotide adenylyltransferase
MIGVLGGTFDPIHFGHLRPALEVLQAVGLSEVRFIPLNQAVHREQPSASAGQRLAMLRAAIGGQPGFVSDDRELKRPGGSYSFDTLASLREDLGQRVPVCLLLGLDAFREFPSWHRPDGILQLAHLIVMRRPGAGGTTGAELERWMDSRMTASAADLNAAPAGRILFQDVTQLDISATGIRRLVARGMSPRYLLPDPALEILEREGLYRGERDD